MVGNGESAYSWGVFPLLLPLFEARSFGAAFGIGPGGAVWDLSFQLGGLFGQFVCSFVSGDVAMAWAPGYCDG